MSRWEVRGTDACVKVDASNWMMAVGSAMEGLGLTGLELSCLICDIQNDGVVRIYDPRQDTALLVRRMEASLAPAVAVEDEPASAGEPEAIDEPGQTESVARSQPDDARPPHGFVLVDPEPNNGGPLSAEDGDAASDREQASETTSAAESLPVAPPPMLTMPKPSLGPWGDLDALDEVNEQFDDEDLAFVQAPQDFVETSPPTGLAEDLFEDTFDIAGATSASEAAGAALTILLKHVPAESAAVLFAGINDTGLRFLAVQGPSADQVRDIVIPFDGGIAGYAYERAADLIVHNAAADPRHLGDVDKKSGYRTQGLLVASLRDEDGVVHGVVELLNPPGRFQTWHLDAARSVARTLAETLGRLD
jgi:hypothetical protein